MQFVGESKVENELEDHEQAPLLRSPAEQKTQSSPNNPDTTVSDTENNPPKTVPNSTTDLPANAPDAVTKPTVKSADEKESGKQVPSDPAPQLERSAAPETNEESAPLLSS